MMLFIAILLTVVAFPLSYVLLIFCGAGLVGIGSSGVSSGIALFMSLFWIVLSAALWIGMLWVVISQWFKVLGIAS